MTKTRGSIVVLPGGSPSHQNAPIISMVLTIFPPLAMSHEILREVSLKPQFNIFS